MRRSQAPSQMGLSKSKRPKLDFVAQPLNNVSSPVISDKEKSNEASSVMRSSQDLLKLLEQKKEDDRTLHTVEQPLSKAKTEEIAKDTLNEANGSTCNRYFKVFWCKASTKKHKHWEEEAVLVVKIANRSVVLQSLEGKVLSQSTGYKLAQLQELEDGSILKVGGREVLIQEAINELAYSSSSCFTEKNKMLNNTKEGLNTINSTPAPLPKPTAKSFVTPFLKQGALPKLASSSNEIKPKHSPLGHMALVLPRPPSDIQWKECQKGTVIVDVVVDPLLCKNLRTHQREGVVFLYECVMGFKTPNMYGAILADEMGLGKTLQTITLLWTLLHQGPFNGRPTINRALIVAPSSLVKNWYKEFRRWLGTERINVFTVDQQNRPIEFLKRPLCPVMIVSYEMLVRSIDEIQQITFDLIVCDEGHRLKNAGNKTSSLLSQLNTNRKVLLTGTPVQNDLKEFFTLADFVNPGILGSLASFRRSFEEPIIQLQQPNCDETQREIGDQSAYELSQLTSKFVLRRTQEVISAHLPPKVENVIFCKPTSAQVNLYRSLLGSVAVRSFLTSGDCGNDHLGFIQALRKLCNHPSFVTADEHADEFDADWGDCASVVGEVLSEVYNPPGASPDSAGKFLVTFALVDSLMKSTKEKIVLVSYSTKILDLFGEACSERGYEYLRLDGATPTNLRMGLIDRFNDRGNPQRIFLLSCKAGGVGLNLVGASRLLLYDIDWNPANDLQAMARIWRDGQKRTVHIYRLLTTGTIEEKIFQRQILKQGLSGAVEGKESTQGHFTKDELKDLFTLREDTNCDTHDLINCSCTELGVSKEEALDVNDYDFEQDDERNCQLGGSADNKGANKRVDQLTEWQHYGPPFFPDVFQDACLESALENITFVFRCIYGGA